jgi:intracellular multiplication protein IcmO
LIEGEAIILFGSRRVYARLFYAGVDLDGPMRLNRPLMLKPPPAGSISGPVNRISEIKEAIGRGWACPDGEPGGNLAVKALVGAFSEAAATGAPVDECVDAAIAAAARVPEAPAPTEEVAAAAPGEIPPAPPTELDPMLRSAGDHEASASESDQVAVAPVTDADKQRDLARIEELAGAPAPVARIAAKEALATQDAIGAEETMFPALPASPRRHYET